MNITLYREKICIVCHKKLPITEFYKAKSMKSGYRNECKECTQKRKKEYIINNIKKEIKRSKK